MALSHRTAQGTLATPTSSLPSYIQKLLWEAVPPLVEDVVTP